MDLGSVWVIQESSSVDVYVRSIETLDFRQVNARPHVVLVTLNIFEATGVNFLQ